MSVREELDEMIGSLGVLNPHGKVLAALARELADSVDVPPDGAGGGKLSISPFANSLARIVTELQQVGVEESEDDDDDWKAIAADAGATPIRNSA